MFGRAKQVLSVVGVLAVTLAGVALPAGAVTFRPGAAGVGDPYFPLEGNGGYDVGHYLLDLSYVPGTHHLTGRVRISAVATQNLSRFDLDFSGMHVGSVQVNGVAASFRRKGQELRVTPRTGLLNRSAFDVTVRYGGSPRTVTGSPIVFGSDYGWEYTRDGAFVGDEPNAARTWFPCNDHPSDKATYTFRITVPSNRRVVANGDFLGTTARGGSKTYTYDETSPMATYLATIDIGKWRFRRGRTPSGIREMVAFDPALSRKVRKQHTYRLTGAVTDYWSRKFGPYPFTSTGAIVDNVPKVGFSLETQTRPLYGFAPDQFTLSHELSHQWFGDSVSVRTWRNIWLNEGFATFSMYLWRQHVGRGSTYHNFKQIYQQLPRDNSFWHQSIANPGRNTMFSEAVYVRGGMTLAALRHRVGSATFFSILRQWTAAHRYRDADTAQFVALAERISGQNLKSFFHVWLWAKSKPASFDAGLIRPGR